MLLDEWFPGFTLFILFLAPAIILMMFAFTLISRVARIKVRPIVMSKREMNFAEVIGYFPIIYLAFVMYEVFEYITQTRATINTRLFTYHLPILAFLIIAVGIGEVAYYMLLTYRHGRVT